MTTLENTSIGLKMDIDDQGLLQIISRDLVPSIKGAMSISLFKYNDVPLAFLIALTEEEDKSGYTKIILSAFGKHGYSSYGERIAKNGLHYYLTCMNTKDDSQEHVLVQSIKEAYDNAVFFTPTVIELSGTIDFKALTLDEQKLGNEIFASKQYTVINIWATTCILCMEILPDLVKWESELPENVQVFYLTAEKEGLANLDKNDLNQKIAELGLNEKNVLLYDNGFSKMIDTVLSATPTTIFVNDKGEIVGDVIIGSNVDNCRKIASQLL